MKLSRLPMNRRKPARGLKPDRRKVEAIQKIPSPRNVKGLLTFLQTCSWFRRFVPNFAKISQPLTQLTKKNAPWTWTPTQQNAFLTLKDALSGPPILRPAERGQPYILRTDASDHALGVALLQGEGSDEHPVEYASRLLSSAERNYSATEREALAIVWAVNKFRGYLEESTTTIITDCQPLRWLMNLKSPTGRLARWALQLQPYNIKIEYTPGRGNVLADTLSRLPEKPPEDIPSNICSVHVELPRRGPTELRDEQLRDPEVKKILDCFSSTEHDATRSWTDRGYLTSSGVLYRYNPDSDSEEPQLVVPLQERIQVLEKHHNAPSAGHGGINATYQRVSQRYYWPGMYKDVHEYVRKCITCQRYKVSNLKPAGLLQTPTLRQRFESFSIDLFGPLPISATGQRWIFVVEDTATRWVELFPLQTATAEECATRLVDDIILRYGVPRQLISDNGTQFISSVMQQLTFCLGIKTSFTPVYHPSANPVERKNRDLKVQLAAQIGTSPHEDWPSKLPSIRFALNTAPNSSTGYSAAYLVYGHEPRTVDDVTNDFRAIVQAENFIPEITPRLLQLDEVIKQVRENHEAAQDRRKNYADSKRRPGPVYQPGDLVLVDRHILSKKAQGLTSKLAPRRDGPYRILTKVGPTSYEIADPENPAEALGKYHTSALRPFVGSADAPDPPVAPIRRRGRPRKKPNVQDS